MAVDDVARVVLGMMDEDVRARVADGDRTALGDLDLTPEEQALVDELIDQLTGDEVSGFNMGRSAGFAAVSYVNTGKPTDPGVAAQWNVAKNGISAKSNPNNMSTCMCGDGPSCSCQTHLCAKSSM